MRLVQRAGPRSTLLLPLRQLLPLKIGGDSRCVGRPPGVIRRVSEQQGRGIMLFTHVYAGVRTKLAAIREKESFY